MVNTKSNLVKGHTCKAGCCVHLLAGYHIGAVLASAGQILKRKLKRLFGDMQDFSDSIDKLYNFASAKYHAKEEQNEKTRQAGKVVLYTPPEW